MFEKILKTFLKFLHLYIAPKIPTHQLGFRFRHSSIHQCHKIVYTTSHSFERKEYCNVVFFERCFALQLKNIFTSTYILVIQTCLSGTFLNVVYASATLSPFPPLACFPPGRHTMPYPSPCLQCRYAFQPLNNCFHRRLYFSQISRIT